MRGGSCAWRSQDVDSGCSDLMAACAPRDWNFFTVLALPSDTLRRSSQAQLHLPRPWRSSPVLSVPSGLSYGLLASRRVVCLSRQGRSRCRSEIPERGEMQRRSRGFVGGQRTDVLAITSAQMITADMIPDAPGVWLYHCHISDHMLAGMAARYEVKGP